MSATAVQTGTIRTRIPARLDRLPWSRFHWLILLGLGTAWILDGLEVTIVGSVASRLTQSGSGISMTASDIGTAAAIYVVGSCTGALFFGQLTDRFGRKKLFMITLGVYLIATAATAASWAPWFFFLMRFFTGTGIGGEYAAINSAIDELIPARARGRIDLIINGSYWVGSMGGSGAALFFLDTSIFAKDLGWRLAFLVGVVLAIAVMFVRKGVPESPRWLFIHGREEEAERLVDGIEHDIEEQTGQRLEPVPARKTLVVRQRKAIPFREIARVAVKVYPRRSILCLALFVGQAFIYNGITFNLGTLMTTFFHVSSGFVPVFVIVYAASNFTGPLVLGRLFDTVGRVPMISGTYLGSAAIAVLLAILFAATNVFGAWTFIVVVMATFFLASAGASAAYLTASEIFPMETRALAIAFFYAIGTAVGGISGPLLFGQLIGTKKVVPVAVAFLIGAGVMAIGGITELFFGVRAEGAQLEDIAKPLTVEDAETGGGRARGASTAAPADGLSHARARAAAEWASAAEHRAAAHEQRAAALAGDEGAQARVQVEERLGDRAERMAQAQEEYAAAAQLRADGHPDGEHAAAAVEHRAEAAAARAHAHERAAAAITAEDEAEAAHDRAGEQAALERARSLEQLAAAEQARERLDHVEGSEAEAADAAAHMHLAWSRMHEQLAVAHERAAAGDEPAAAEARNEARVHEEQARAAQYRVEAAQRRGDAAEESALAEQGEEQAEHDAIEQRIRGRLQRRQQRQRAGLRRYLPGPGSGTWTPPLNNPPPPPEAALDPQIEAIRRALDEHGATERSDLAQLVGARYWGPGVFRHALRIAVEDGEIDRVGRNTYANAAERHRPDQS